MHKEKRIEKKLCGDLHVHMHHQERCTQQRNMQDNDCGVTIICSKSEQRHGLLSAVP